METVLVTGGAGYVGCVLVHHLLNEHYQVRVLDRFRHENPALASYCRASNLEIVKGDCRDIEVLKNALKGVDWIIPLAGIVGAPACEKDKDLAWGTNYHAIRILTELTTKPIIFPNTNSGYGTTPLNTVADETTPLKPISLYGQTKAAAEDLVLAQGGVSLRFATAFGCSPRMRTDLLVNDFTLRAVRDRCIVLYEPHFRRNFVHVRDMASAFIHIIQHWRQTRPLGVFNCGLAYTASKRQLCEAIRKEVPEFYIHEASVGEDPDKRDYSVSSDRLLDSGFKFTVSLTEGIKELVKAYIMFPPENFKNA